VRENNEGEYSSIGGRLYEGTEDEVVVQQSTFTRKGVDRILRYAFELARSRPKKHLTSATKSNGISITMPYWDERVEAMSKHYPEVKVDKFHIDILCAHFVQRPDRFDVVVGSNLFGDILSDLGPGVTGTIGIAPSANLNPERDYPSMFEPVHGSAPDIAGQGIANPIGGCRGHRRGPRRRASRGVWVQFERPLRAGSPATRSIHPAADVRRFEIAPRRERREPRPGSHLGGADDQREAGRARGAIGRCRHRRHGGVGCGGEDRAQTALPAARGSVRRGRDTACLRLRGRWLLLPGQGPFSAAGRDAAIRRARLHGGEDEDRGRAARGGSPPD